MTDNSFGDVLLVPFPFTDLTGSKQRPVVVVSSTRYHRERPDLLLMPNQPNAQKARFGDVVVSDISSARLIKDGVVKPLIFTIEMTLVRKALGRLVDDDKQALRHSIAQLIG